MMKMSHYVRSSISKHCRLVSAAVGDHIGALGIELIDT